MPHATLGKLELKSRLKKLVLPSGRAPRAILAGLLRGLTMHLDLAHDSQRWLGLQERELHGWLQKFSAGIATAIDVGASDGMYTLFFLGKTTARKVLAFEPNAESLRRLKENLKENGLEGDPGLEMVCKYVGARNEGDVTTLDSFLPTLIPPCLVKVDVDGGEADVLRGAQELLAVRDVRWIIEVHSQGLENECLQILEEAGYRTRRIPNAWWRRFIPELRPIEVNHWLAATTDDSLV